MTRVPIIGPILLLTIAPTVVSVLAQSVVQPSSTAQQPDGLRAVHTLLMTRQISTWMDVPEPPYRVAITIKNKLERAGFRVVFDPTESHDAALVISYQETPGQEYARLEQGTKILCEITLQQPGDGAHGQNFAHRIEAATSWPTPVGSLYWDAVQHLEENPYYYYLGELLQGWLTAQSDAGAVFSRMLRQPPLIISMGGEDAQLTAQAAANQVARLDAIRELGRMKDKRAIETLWELVERPNQQEREAALTAIGEMSDPAVLDRLIELRESQQETSMRALVEKVIARIRQLQ
ncbi:MAG TPA: HEAT repeat domain-containing protein [Nitrospiraceae bacterium]|nr:HEAT repeat domain-containing protein [Nitrospiraceae bacterium]